MFVPMRRNSFGVLNRNETRKFLPVLPFLKLIRFSNAPTVIADILAGAMLAGATWKNTQSVAILALASFFFYSMGMALNDLFDVEEDRKNRNLRPIVQGSLSVTFVRLLCLSLFFFGMVSCCTVGLVQSNLADPYRPALLGSLLSLSIWLYDGPAKKTAFAPLVMGLCRGLNLLLGASLVGEEFSSLAPSATLLNWSFDVWLFAIAITLYIAGVTWYARMEHQITSDKEKSSTLRSLLLLGLAGITSGFALLLLIPFAGQIWKLAIEGLRLNVSFFQIGLAWVVVVLWIGFGVLRNAVVGYQKPTAANIKKTIISGLGAIVFWDAAVAFYASPSNWHVALLCLAMFIPIKLLRKSIPPT